MFEALEGGVIEPIKWDKEHLQPERSIMVLDESSQSLFLWHGSKQGLVARRTALRQAESLKGHGYTLGKSIIGRDIKNLKEIDQRKVGRDPDTDEINAELQAVINKEYQEVEDYVVTFQKGDIKSPIAASKAVMKPKPKPAPKPKPEIKIQPKPEVKIEVPSKKKVEKAPMEKVAEEIDLLTQVKVGFVLSAITDHYQDIWADF